VLVTGTAEGSRDVATALATDPAGDVVVAGTVETAYGPVRGADFFVAKLAGDTGAERWRRIVTFPYGQPFAIAVDARGDVVVGGHLKNIETGADWTVVRLAGDTGDERWRHVVDGPAPDRTLLKPSRSRRRAASWSLARCRRRPRAGKSWSRGSMVPPASSDGAASPRTTTPRYHRPWP
jgi:hypothetical protein